MDAPLSLGSDVEDAYAFVSGMGIARGLLADLGPADQETARAELRSTLAAAQGPDGIAFHSSAWRITARRP